MVIIIDEYGVDLAKKNKRFLLRNGEKQQQISPFRVTAIHVRKACDISSPAILLAAEFSIPILFFNYAGKVKARIWQPYFGSKAEIRRQQLRYSDHQEGMAWVCARMQDKVAGQIKVLEWLSQRIIGQINNLSLTIEKINHLKTGLLQPALKPAEIRVLEAQISKLYWQAYFRTLKKYQSADKRSRQPAQDPLNSLLNYGYGMLYGEVEAAVLTAGLDPQTGILHREEYNRPAFVFDAIEPFRPWVDRLVGEMALSGTIKSTWFDQQPQKVWLSKSGKKEFIPAWYKMINTATRHKGKRIKRKDQIQKLMTQLAQYLLNDFKDTPQ
ncbi:MAG TPA: CRISPR-associated endonuclease Cas1 [Bacteroidetes bacterium]|nr:CRISPR-associated endonuclease Cas1 [Bacteroidota bacterium]